MNVKYYLVTLCDKELQRTPEFRNQLVVGMSPVEWFTLSRIAAQYVLINFWEITEVEFESFSHDDQNSAWDFYQQHESCHEDA